jgi:ABC-type glutathione transport system ATPase component
MDTILSIENLAISIPTQKRNIVNDVSFDIKPGEIVVLSGANGCGKSTIIKAIMSDSDLY